MNSDSLPVCIQIRQLPGISFSLNSSSNLKESIFNPVVSSFTITKKEDDPCIIGEKVYFSVNIQNNHNTSVTISSVEAMDISERSRNPLEECNQTADGNASLSKSFQLYDHSNRILHYSRLLCDVGKHTIRVVVYYMDAVSTYTVSSELSFQVVKPFSLAFTRYQLSNTSYLINSTITNNLSKPLTITNISIYNMASFVKESYNSFNEPISLQSGKKYSHSCILDGTLKEKTSIGSICVQFRTPGHETIRLNSSAITIENLHSPIIRGFYEVEGELTQMKVSSIFAVLTNYSSTMQSIHLDWSKSSSPIQFIGECCFNRIIPPQKTIRLSLQVLPLLKGKFELGIPVIPKHNDERDKGIQFSSTTIFVQ